MSAERTEPRPAPRLDVVVVNWNTGPHLRSCLESLAAHQAEVHLGDVVVVDNASSDGSHRVGDTGVSVTLLRNDANRGFAAACNQGAALGAGELLLFLNPDTRLSAGTLRHAVAATDGPGTERRGIVGGLLRSPDGSVTISASRFPTLRNVVTGTLHLDRLLPRRLAPRHLGPDELRESGEVDQVIGAFFLVRRALFERLGGFDERYFVYYEEVDLTRRARALGWSSYLVHDASLEHVGNVSAHASGGAALGYSLRSRAEYAAAHWPTPQRYALAAFTVLVELPVRWLRARRHSRAEAAAVRTAAAHYLRGTRGRSSA